MTALKRDGFKSAAVDLALALSLVSGNDFQRYNSVTSSYWTPFSRGNDNSDRMTTDLMDLKLLP